MSEKVAFLFPGQGSQYVGMGKDMVNAFPEVKEIFEQVDDICQKPISQLCFDGPADELTLTINLQPAITAVSLACLASLDKSGIKPMVSAGHSLGEYAALSATGAVSSYDALRLVKKRGELMHRESLENPGSMAAVLGMPLAKVDQIVARAAGEGVIAVANHNTADQIVITGENEPISRAVDLIKDNGGKAIPLKVSGAWHCPLMGNAVDDFRRFMRDVRFSTPETTMLFNATAESENQPENIKEILARQLVSPVKWYDIVLKMLDEGVNVFVEVGPKKVLSRLLKKIIPPEREIKLFNVENPESLDRLLALKF